MLRIIIQRKMFLTILLFILFLLPDSASAQVDYKALVTIPGISDGAGVTDYLGGLYTFLISVVGVVAMGAIVIGGARYLTSAGNPSAIEDAKHTIYSAIYGLILAITSWVIVKTINPDILVLKNPNVTETTAEIKIAETAKCALPGGLGTSAYPCRCIDGENVKALNPTDPCGLVCADASKQDITGVGTLFVAYHCIGPRLIFIGTGLVMNADGISANMKLGSDITIDAYNSSIFPDAITKAGSKYDWNINEFSKLGDKTGILYPIETKDIFNYAGVYEIHLRIVPAIGPGAPETRNVAPFWLYVVP